MSNEEGPVLAPPGSAKAGTKIRIIEDQEAARVCARHIKALGHRRFGIVTFPLHADGYSGPIDKKRLEKACFEVARR